MQIKTGREEQFNKELLVTCKGLWPINTVALAAILPLFPLQQARKNNIYF